MSQPTFTLWPWKILSMLVPVMALVAAGVAEKYEAPKEDSFAIFFSVIAAGNAYLFAMAIGDFGRSVVAIPIGAVAGWIAVLVFSYGPPSILFIALMAVVMLLSVVSRSAAAGHGCLALVMLFFLALGAIEAPGRGDPALSMLAGYPFVCAVVAGCMPLQRDFLGVCQAGIAGARAALHGMVAGIFVFGFGAVILGLSPRFGSAGILVAGGALIALAAMMINYFCVKFIFTAVHRVVAPAPQSPGTPYDENDSDPLKAEKLNVSSAPTDASPIGSGDAPKDSG